MSALQDRRARLLVALYDKFGEAATWSPAAGGADVTLTLRRKGEEVALGFGGSEGLVEKDLFRVRRSELASAAQGDVVTITETGEVFRIVGEPRLVKTGLEWLCEPAELRAF